MSPIEKATYRVDFGGELTIGMATYGNVATTSVALEHLFASAGGDYELILVDNGSQDEGMTRQLLQSACEQHDNTRMFAFQDNQEYTGAVNAVLSHATGNQVLFVSNDVFVTPSYIRELTELVRDNERIGIVRGCANFVDNSRRTHNHVFDGPVESVEALFVEAMKVRNRMCGQWIADDYLVGDAFLVRRSVLQCIGTFDPLFFGYFGDLDFGLRAQIAGFDIALAQGALCWHEEAANFNVLDEATRAQRIGLRWQRLYENWARFKIKYELPVYWDYPGGNNIPWEKLRAEPFDPELVYCKPANYADHEVMIPKHGRAATDGEG